MERVLAFKPPFPRGLSWLAGDRSPGSRESVGRTFPRALCRPQWPALSRACSFLHPGHSGGTASASHRTSLDHRPYVRGRVYPPGPVTWLAWGANLVTTFEVKELISIPTLANKFLNALSVWAVPTRRKSAKDGEPGQGFEAEQGR